jgi:hypothetical protein
MYAFGLNNNHTKDDNTLKFFAEASAREVIALGDLGAFNNVNLVLHQSFKQYEDRSGTSLDENNYVDNIWENKCGECGTGIYVCFDMPCMKMPCIDLCPIDCPEECEIKDCEDSSSPCDRLMAGTSTNVRLGQVYSDEVSTHKSLETDKLNIKNRQHYDGAQIRMKNGNYTAKVGYGLLGKNKAGMDHLDEDQRNVLDLQLDINLGKFGKASIGHLNHDNKSTKDIGFTYVRYDLCFNQFNIRTAYNSPEDSSEDENFSLSLGSEMNGVDTELTYIKKGDDKNWAITASKNLDEDTVGFIHYDSDRKQIDLGCKGGFLLSLEGASACEPCIE